MKIINILYYNFIFRCANFQMEISIKEILKIIIGKEKELKLNFI